MSFLFYTANLFLLVSFVVFVRQVVRAPEGHEDEAGFHFGATAPQRPTAPVRRTKTAPAFAKMSSRHLAA